VAHRQSTTRTNRRPRCGPGHGPSTGMTCCSCTGGFDLTALRPHVPALLEVATHDGEARVSLVLFRLRVRPRGLPFLPGFPTWWR